MFMKSVPFWLLLVLTQPALAGGGWEKLGSRTVKLKSESDSIHVGVYEGHFDKIKLKVRKNGVHFLDVKVHYANGSVQDIAVRGFIKKGGESRVIDLKGENRTIKRVTFRYKSNNKNLKGKAIVELWGRH